MFGAPGPDVDKRVERLAKPRTLSAQQVEATERLRRKLPHAEVEVDPLLGSPKLLRAKEGLLTGPRGEGAILPKGLADRNDRDGVVRGVLNEYPDLFGHDAEALDSAKRQRDYITPHNGMRTVVWEQHVDDIPVYESVLVANLTKNDELIMMSSRFVVKPEQGIAARRRQAAKAQKAPIAARQALEKAIGMLGEDVPVNGIHQRVPPDGPRQRQRFKAGHLPDEAELALTWFPLDETDLRLAWIVEVTRSENAERFRALVDAENGEVLHFRKLTFDAAPATFRVFTKDSPSPLSPAYPALTTDQPPLVERELVTFSALNTNASPIGWIADNENHTRGNNVIAHLDRDGDNVPDLPRPAGAPFRVFDFPLDLSDSPTNYSQASAVQLFYWCNWMHDRLYELGFTEAAGNFQKDNFGRGGRDSDPIIADAQDGAGFNNANYTPAPDGSSPRIQMFLFNGPNPWRDASLDAEVILHEYAHGLSDRLVGGGIGIYRDHAIGLSEGWSDFYAMALLSDPSDDPDGSYAYGAYMSYKLTQMPWNYYFGIRSYPYTTDLSKNPVTLKDIDPPQESVYPGIPRNPRVTSPGNEVHRIGEVWCSILWDARANLIRKHGSAAGNELMLRLVTDAMKLSPANPTMDLARDAILLADRVNTGGANHFELWDAFGRRGLGVGAAVSDSFFQGSFVRASFRVPDPLQIAPDSALVFRRSPAGVFTPESRTFTLVNGRHSPLQWSSFAPSSFELEPSRGTLAAGESTIVTVRLTPAASSLSAGTFSNVVYFTNLTSGNVTNRGVVLKNGTSEFLAESFGVDDFDLKNTTLTFTPDGSSNFYSVCRSPAASFPVDPGGSSDLRLIDDSYRLMTLTGGAEISLFGLRTNRVLVGSNGDLIYELPGYYTNNSALGLYAEVFHSGLSTFFERLRIGALYADLNPGARGSVLWKQLPDRVAVTWLDVPEFGRNNSNNFQVEAFYEGIIRFTWLGVAVEEPISGLSRGGGIPAFAVDRDLSSSTSCVPGLHLVAPAQLQEGAPQSEAIVSWAQALSAPLTIHLHCSEPDRLRIPASVALPAGQRSVRFAIIAADDALLNGTRLVQLTATAANLEAGTATVEVIDDELASITLSVPSRLAEGSGLLPESGTLSIDKTPMANVRIGLASSASNLVRVPPYVVIPAGVTSAKFDLTIGDDEFFNPARTVVITAFAGAWEGDSETIEIVDDEAPVLELMLPSEITETGGTNQGIVASPGYLETNLVVGLSVDRPDLLRVPESIIIQTSRMIGSNLFIAASRVAIFDLVPTNNSQLDGNQLVTITATAPGFATATGSLLMIDDEFPSTPRNLSPPDGQTNVPVRAGLTWNTERPEALGTTTYEILLGTNSTPTNLVGQTSQRNFLTPELHLATTYYWQVVATRENVRVPGPIWRFTTTDWFYFTVTSTSSVQRVGVPFEVTVMARDSLAQPLTLYAGTPLLHAAAVRPGDSTILITEVDAGPTDRVEFSNVSANNVDISRWQVALYDWTHWPQPHTVFEIPAGTVCPAGDVFHVRRTPPQALPGTYPRFNIGDVPFWSHHATINPVAVLLRDAAGRTVDFMCAVEGDPYSISQPSIITTNDWIGAPIEFTSNQTHTYQRIGRSDRNSAADWTTTVGNVELPNINLVMPFVSTNFIPVWPTMLSGFENGVWRGTVTLFQLHTNVILQVDDGLGHSGSSPRLIVSAWDDLAVEIAPLHVARPIAGTTFEYRFDVTNASATAATNVRFTNSFAPAVEILSVVPSQGRCSINAGMVVCELNELGPTNRAQVTVVVRPDRAGVLTAHTSVGQSEAESSLENNTASLSSLIEHISLSVTNSTTVETDVGSTQMVFRLQLSQPISLPVSVNYTTSNFTASAGSDYVAAEGTVRLAPGQTNATVAIEVLGDTMPEPNELLFLNFTSPVNCVTPTARVFGIIANNDLLLYIRAAPVTVSEGNEGERIAEFNVSLTTPSGRFVTVYYYTSDGTASGGADYIPTDGWLFFPPGVTNLPVTVRLPADRVFETNEFFHLNFTYAVNAFPSPAEVPCTILDDDETEFHSLVWSTIGPTQFLQVPFSATLTALDGLGRRVPGFNGSVSLLAGRQSQMVTIGSGTNLWEHPLGAAFHDGRLQVLYYSNEVGRAGRITALALNIGKTPDQVLNNWTIRLKHTSADSLDAAAWETNGWTTVLQTNQTFARGWFTFNLQKPFLYNGQDHLMVDFSFDNSSFSSNGLCRATTSSVARALSLQTDSAFGKPLDWSGNVPRSVRQTRFPNIRFFLDTPLPISPETVANFNAGVWSGEITALQHGKQVSITANDGNGHIGLSGIFDVLRLDLDGDGMADDWEQANKINDPNSDPDRDGHINLHEFFAGTDPNSAASVLRMIGIRTVTTGLAVDFHSVAGKRYILERSAGLDAANWTSASGAINGSGGLLTVVDGTPPGGQQFYRLKVLPEE